MNLVQQFPDVSLQMRNRVKRNQESHHEKRMSMRDLKPNDPELVRFYDHEFKKWHHTLTLIIAVGIACLYGVILAASGIIRLIVMNGNYSNT